MDGNYRQHARNFQNARQQFPNGNRYDAHNPTMTKPSFGDSKPSFSNPQRGDPQGRHHPLPPQQTFQKSSMGITQGPVRSSLVLSQHAPGHNVRHTNPDVNPSASDRQSYGRLHQNQQSSDPQDRRPGPVKPGLLRAPVAETEGSQQSHGPRSQMFHEQGWGEGGGKNSAGKRGLLGDKPGQKRGLLGERPSPQSGQYSSPRGRQQPNPSTRQRPFVQTGQAGTRQLGEDVGERRNNGRERAQTNQMKYAGNFQDTKEPSGSTFQQRNGSNNRANKDLKECTLPDCHQSFGSSKDHMYRCHLPKIFNMNFSLRNPVLQEQRMQALQALTTSILGSGASLEELCLFLRNQNILPHNLPITGKTDESMRDFCRQFGYHEPEVFCIYTINSPAVLLHWKALSCLLQFITPVQREEFRLLFHAEGLELEWDLLKSTKQQQQQNMNPTGNPSGNPSQFTSIPPVRGVTETWLGNSEDHQSHDHRSMQGSSYIPGSVSSTGSRHSRIDFFEETSPGEYEIDPDELEDLSADEGDQGESSESEPEEGVKLTKITDKEKGLSKSQVRRRRRQRSQKRKQQRQRKGQRRIKKNYEARRIDRQIKRLNALNTCPIPGCSQTQDLQEHAFRVHLPKIFDLDLPMSDPNLHSMRWITLRDLSTYILGPDAYVKDLLEFFRSKNIMPQNAEITPSMEVAMRALCQHQGLEIPPVFTVWLPNSPVILLHWRALLGLLQYTSPRCQKLFKSAFAKATLDGLSLEDVKNNDQHGLSWEVKPDHHQTHRGIEEEYKRYEEYPRNIENPAGGFLYSNFDREYSPAPQEEEKFHRQTPPPDFDRQVLSTPHEHPRSPERVALMDSHFYFGRLCMLFNATNTSPSNLLSNLGVHAQPRVPADLIGGAIVYSNPKSFSVGGFPNYPGWRNCFGVDASAAPELLQEEFETVSVLTNSAKAAFGDIGLDRSINKDLWMEQEAKFRQLLTLCTPAQPMILKVVGPHGDPYCFDVSSRVRDLVRRQSSPQQHIHLCNFRGGEMMVREWLEDFPNCYFGFSRRILEFDEEQVKGVRAVPDNRLLLESDISLPGDEQNILQTSPLFLGEVASAMAAIRSDTLHNVAQLTVSNTCRLYNL